MRLRKHVPPALACASALFVAQPAAAQDYYTGEVLLYANSACPAGTREADGSLVSISSYTHLGVILGTTFGGNGVTSFGLPDLRGRTAIGLGQGPGLASYGFGQAGGAESATVPQVGHQHAVTLRAYAGPPDTNDPSGAAFADFPAGVSIYYSDAGPQPPAGDPVLPQDGPMANGTVATQSAGGGQPVPLPAPYLVLRYCIVMEGLAPSRP